MIKKLKLFLFILVLTPMICAAYGVLHDQITYTISPEYYTRFKFIQFHMTGLEDLGISDRLAAAIVGVYATWWMGIPIALMYGGILMCFPDGTDSRRFYFRAILITLPVTVLFSMAGYVSGIFHWQDTRGWFIPPDLRDTESFIRVGSMHNYSYLGGAAGLMAGILYLVILRSKKEGRS